MIKALPETGVEGLTSWLWEVLAAGVPTTLGTGAEPDMLVQIYDVYRRSAVPRQECVKAAVARAIGEWQEPARSHDLLRELIFLAARIRSTESAVPLCRLLERKKLWRIAAPPEALEVSATAIRVLAGFLPADGAEVARVLSTLYFADSVHASLAPALFGALCRHAPGDYPYLLGRYLVLREAPSAGADDSLVFGFFVDSVPAETIAAEFGRLARTEKDFLVFWLRNADILPLGLVPDFQVGELGYDEAVVRLQDVSGKSFELERTRGETGLWKLVRMSSRDSFRERILQRLSGP